MATPPRPSTRTVPPAGFGQNVTSWCFCVLRPSLVVMTKESLKKKKKKRGGRKIRIYMLYILRIKDPLTNLLRTNKRSHNGTLTKP